jgi:predicted nucleic acid-binding protein
MDTGVLVAGLYSRNEAHRCLQAWHQGIFHLAVSEEVFEEYRRVA